MFKDFFGTETPQQFFVMLFFCFVGVTISLLFNASNRNANSPETPYHFDIWFLIKDNWKRVVLNLLLIYVTIRFYPDVFDGKQLTPFLALGIGIGWDRLAQFIKEKTGLLNIKRES